MPVTKLTSSDLAKLRAQFAPAAVMAEASAPAAPVVPLAISDDVPLIDEDSEAELIAALTAKQHESQYTLVDFEDAVDLIHAADASMSAGSRSLHDWQTETLLFLSGKFHKFSKKQPLRFYMPAANGSGKDAYIIAPLAVFLTLCKIRHRVVITSSSYNQLKTQTENYIRSLCSRLNYRLAELGVCKKAFVIKKEHIACTLTGSEIVMFVTDEAGKAEGYHPFPDNRDEELTIIVNEAKTVPEDIFHALSRCTYNRWIEISSPGQDSGHFYNSVKTAITYPQPYVLGSKYCRFVTSYDCPHIPQERIDQDKEDYGEHSPIFRSKHLAQFSSYDQQVVIRRDTLQTCLHRASIKIDIGLPRRAGLDLAAGGDENCLYVFDNNQFIGRETFRASDTDSVTINALITFFQKYALKAENIFADDGGVGHGILDNLRGRGWDVNRVLNQGKPRNSSGAYANRGAELWFNFARLVQESVVILPVDDHKLHDQLTSRYYHQQNVTGRIALESKKEARAKGHSSPDRADALVLAFCGLTLADFRDGKRTELNVRVDPEQDALSKRDAQMKYLMQERKTKPAGVVFNSASNLLRSIYGK